MRTCLSERGQKFLALADKVAPAFAERAARHDHDNTFPFENYDDLRAAGFMRLTVPEELGGLGADLADLLVVLERFAAADGSTSLAYAMHSSPVCSWAYAWRRSQDPQLAFPLQMAAQGKLVFAVIPSEIGTSNLYLDAKTKAERVDGGFRISGRKNFGTNTSVATHCATTARYEDPEYGPHLIGLLVDLSSPGVSIEPTWDTLGMRATQSNDVVFDNLFVPEQNLYHSVPVGHLDAKFLEQVFAHAAPCFGAVYTGIAGGALSWAVEQIHRRGLTRDARVQDAIAEAETLREINRSVLYRHADEVTSRRLFEQLGVQEGVARCAFVKNVCTNNAATIMRRLVDVLGGSAFVRSQPFEKMWRDVQAGLIMPISNRTGNELIGASALDVEVVPAVGDQRDRPALSTLGSTW